MVSTGGSNPLGLGSIPKWGRQIFRQEPVIWHRSNSPAADLKTIGELTKEMKYVKFYLDNGYGGTQIDYASFENEVSEDEIDEMLTELAEDNAEAFEYLAMDGDEWASDEEQEEYYENASTYCTWAYVTEEEYYDEI